MMRMLPGSSFMAIFCTTRAWFRKAKLPPARPGKESALEVLDLDFSYITGSPVLRNIDFKIGKGEMLSIVGKNGAGKSTLSNLVCGFISPDRGSILLGGTDISSKSIKERGEVIGLVMQNPNQMISKPMIYDEVALGLAVRGGKDLLGCGLPRTVWAEEAEYLTFFHLKIQSFQRLPALLIGKDEILYFYHSSSPHFFFLSSGFRLFPHHRINRTLTANITAIPAIIPAH